MKTTLYYIHDPMCSWCWGFSETLLELLVRLPEDIKVQRLLGGLAADSNEIMPEQMQQSIRQNWSRIEQTIPNIKFNFDFWIKNTPRRSTYPACRAVIAARQQGEEYEVKMIQAIQNAYYKKARNPSDDVILSDIANEVGLHISKFKQAYTSSSVNQILNNEMMQCREMFIESYPSLVLVKDGNITNIDIDYTSYRVMLDKIINAYK